MTVQISKDVEPGRNKEILYCFLLIQVSHQPLFLINNLRKRHAFMTLQACSNLSNHFGITAIILNRLNDNSIGKRLPRLFFTFFTITFSDDHFDSSQNWLNKFSQDLSMPMYIE